MNEFKWIICDLDGTLIHHKNNENIIYPDVVNKLNEVVKKNKTNMSIATGRHYRDVLDIIEDSGIKMPPNSFIIGANGCQIYSVDSQNLILNRVLEENIVKKEMPKIVSFLDQHLPNETVIFAYGENETIYFIKNKSSRFQEMFDKVLKYENNNGTFNYLVVDDLNDIKNITKFCIEFWYDITNPLALIDNLRSISNEVDYANTGAKFMEIIVKDVNKATAIDIINKNYYQLDRKDIIVFGDSGNDVEMMDFAGTSITRHDARPEIKERATLIYEGGASKFVKNALIDLFK